MRKLENGLIKGHTINDKVNLELNYMSTKPASSQLKYQITSDLLHKNFKINSLRDMGEIPGVWLTLKVKTDRNA